MSRLARVGGGRERSRSLERNTRFRFDTSRRGRRRRRLLLVGEGRYKEDTTADLSESVLQKCALWMVKTRLLSHSVSRIVVSNLLFFRRRFLFAALVSSARDTSLHFVSDLPDFDVAERSAPCRFSLRIPYINCNTVTNRVDRSLETDREKEKRNLCEGKKGRKKLQRSGRGIVSFLSHK